MITPKKPRTHGLKPIREIVRSIVDAAPTVTTATFDRITALFRVDRRT